jgi:hypothetical protein
MKTITLNEFTSNFMEISENLTSSEVRMLYLLITKPDVIKISQQTFASEIGTNRRTINIGYKKLLKHGYISMIDIPNQHQVDIGTNITNAQVADNYLIVPDIKNTENTISTTGNKIEKENNSKIEKDKNSNNTNLDMEGTNEFSTSSSLYDKFLQNILVNQQYGTIPQFFEEFPNKHTEILIDIKNNLPEFIDFLSRKYGFEEELRVLRISNSQIKELKRNIFHKEKFCNELTSDYINYFQKERKRDAIEVVRQALIYYPLTFEKFLYDIRDYKYDDFDEIVQAMIKEIYKTDRLYKQD